MCLADWSSRWERGDLQELEGGGGGREGGKDGGEKDGGEKGGIIMYIIIKLPSHLLTSLGPFRPRFR